jgi:hypothetical protein
MARSKLLFGHNSLVNAWIGARGAGECPEGSYQAIGLVHLEKGLVGGLAFYNANKYNCYANIALLPGVYWRPLLHCGLLYAFSQLALRRLTFLVSSDNIRSISLVTALGAVHEATLREAGSEGEDLHIYALFAESCPMWRKLREQRRQRTPSPGSPGNHPPSDPGE